MLPIQALKFTRLFEKKSGIVITSKDEAEFNWQLLEGLANYPEEAEVFHKAHAALQEAVKAGRVTVVWVPVAQ